MSQADLKEAKSLLRKELKLRIEAYLRLTYRRDHVDHVAAERAYQEALRLGKKLESLGAKVHIPFARHNRPEDPMTSPSTNEPRRTVST